MTWYEGCLSAGTILWTAWNAYEWFKGRREYNASCAAFDLEMDKTRDAWKLVVDKAEARRQLEATGPLLAELGPVNVDADGREVE